jgi:hypothetical protein
MTEDEHLPHIIWDEQPGSWDDEGHYDPDAPAVVLPSTLDLKGEVT